MQTYLYKTKMLPDGKIRLTRKKLKSAYITCEKYTYPSDFVSLAKEVLKIHEETEEYVYLFCLNTNHELLGIFEISHGSICEAYISPREIFLKAFHLNTATVLLMHNHPSGNARPSREDILATKYINEAGILMRIRLIDHIIIGADTYYSIKEHGGF